MKTLKSIDGKSLLIGGLLACTIFFATGAGAGSGAKIDPATGLPLGQGLPSGGKPMINPITGLPLAGGGPGFDPKAGIPAKGLPGMGVPGQAIDPVTGLPVGGMGGMGQRWNPLQGQVWYVKEFTMDEVNKGVKTRGYELTGHSSWRGNTQYWVGRKRFK